MAPHVDLFRTDDVLAQLLATGHVDWSLILRCGGVDVLEVEHRELLELRVSAGVVVVVTEPV